MASLKDKRKKASKVNKELKNVGVIARFMVDIGVVGQFLTSDLKPKGFVSLDVEDAPAEATRLANELTGEDNNRLMTCLYIGWKPDTALTGNFKPKFYALEDESKRRPQTLKRQGDFTYDHLPAEIEGGREFWGHVQTVRLPENYGGDLSLNFGDEGGFNEGAILITYIPNKKEALALLKNLQEEVVTQDDLASQAGVSRGYDEAWKAQQAAKDGKDGDTPQLSAISAVTAAHHDTLEGFLSDETVKFITAAYEKNASDVEKTAAECGASPGDLAVLMGNKDYFTDLMTQTGKGEQEAVALVTKDLDVPVADVCNLLGIQEPTF